MKKMLLALAIVPSLVFAMDSGNNGINNNKNDSSSSSSSSSSLQGEQKPSFAIVDEYVAARNAYTPHYEGRSCLQCCLYVTGAYLCFGGVVADRLPVDARLAATGTGVATILAGRFAGPNTNITQRYEAARNNLRALIATGDTNFREKNSDGLTLAAVLTAQNDHVIQDALKKRETALALENSTQQGME